jgi:hypothetical protein
VQNEVTSRLARTVDVELVKDVSRRIEQDKTINPDARDLVMRGWAWRYRRASKETRQEALLPFEGALELDPRSVDARSPVASSHGKDLAMWRPDPSGPQGPMQVGAAVATDVMELLAPRMRLRQYELLR